MLPRWKSKIEAKVYLYTCISLMNCKSLLKLDFGISVINHVRGWGEGFSFKEILTKKGEVKKLKIRKVWKLWRTEKGF